MTDKPAAPPAPAEPQGDIYATGDYYQASLMSRARKVPIGISVGATNGSSLDLAKRLAILLNLAAVGSAPLASPDPKEHAAWLVEVQPTGGPQWWTGRGDEWTPYVDGTTRNPTLSAIRFARQEDADRAIGWLVDKGIGHGAKATEHLWL